MRLDQLIREYKTKLAFLDDLISHIASYFNLPLSQSIYTASFYSDVGSKFGGALFFTCMST